MAVKVETYQKCEVATIQRDENDLRRRDLAKSLGLTAQGELESVNRMELAACIWPVLTSHELAIWCRFLPTVYSTVPQNDRQRKWHSYAYDVIPEDALEQLRVAEKSRLFDRLEIWTPEVQQDPVAIGVLEHLGETKRHLIVRWGESLLPFEEIRKKVELELCYGRDIVVRLLEHHKIKIKGWVGFDGRSLLHWCCGKRMVKVRVHSNEYQHLRGCLTCSELVPKPCDCGW